MARGDPGSAEVWLRLRSRFPSFCWLPPACSFALSRSLKRWTRVSSPRTFFCSHWIALGAQKQSVVALVICQGIKVVAGGLAVGVIAAFGLSRFIANRLYGISPADPLVLAIVSILLVLIALLACRLPARRAACLDPMESLRYE